jgi:Spy/CpxP family protein refolding chaperone
LQALAKESGDDLILPSRILIDKNRNQGFNTNMKTLESALRVAIFAIVVNAISGSTMFAQTPAKSQTKKAAEKSETPSRRLPTGYGQLDLTGDQREKIYAVQEKHAEQLAKLNQEIAALRARIASESEAVLTPAQKSQLTRYRSEAKGKSKAETKEAPKSKAATKK